MAASAMGALVPYGWSERVFTLWNALASGSLPPSSRPGRVLGIERGACEVVGPDGRVELLRGRATVAVGDWVAVSGGRVLCVLDRWSALCRADPGGGRQGGVQVLAANVDVVAITVPADRLHVARVEREVTLAWESGARPIVVLTKADLDDGAGLRQALSRVAGVDVLGTSARRGDGVAELQAVLGPGVTGVLFGPSGAGKSTLVNALLGQPVQRTGDTRTVDGRGRHTTTSRRLLCLPGGGTVIDMPGLRSLGMAGTPDLTAAFADIDGLARGCRFRDCAHGTEPGCAVRAAVAAGNLDRGRLASFTKLGREQEAERRRSDPLAARQARRIAHQRTMDARRHDKRRPW